jgi:hypothetical protein
MESRVIEKISGQGLVATHKTIILQDLTLFFHFTRPDPVFSSFSPPLFQKGGLNSYLMTRKLSFYYTCEDIYGNFIFGVFCMKMKRGMVIPATN